MIDHFLEFHRRFLAVALCKVGFTSQVSGQKDVKLAPLIRRHWREEFHGSHGIVSFELYGGSNLREPDLTGVTARRSVAGDTVRHIPGQR
jgi:hypothetical protein